MKLSVILMTRNSTQFLTPALSSVLPYASEVFVFDTGSTDRTMVLIRRARKQFQGPFHIWQEQLPEVKFEKPGNSQYTAVREFLLSRCTGDWVLQLDDDEVYPKETMEEFMARASRESHWLYAVPLVNFVAPYRKVVSSHFKATVRFWKNDPKFHYDGGFPFEMLTYNYLPYSNPTFPHTAGELKSPLFHFGKMKQNYWRNGREKRDPSLIEGAYEEEYRNPMIERLAPQLGW